MGYIGIVFHVIENQLQQLVNAYIATAKKKHQEETLGEILKKWIPIKLIVKLIIGWAASFALIRPLEKWLGWSTKVDTTIWIGTLSFYGAVAIGIIAITPWLAKLSSKILPVFLGSAVENGLLVWTRQNEYENRTLTEVMEEKIEKEKPGIDIIAVNIIVYTLSLIVAILIFLPLGMWLPVRLEASILVTMLVWILDVIGRVNLIAFLLYNEGIWTLYRSLKKMHDANKTLCKKCANNEETD